MTAKEARDLLNANDTVLRDKFLLEIYQEIRMACASQNSSCTFERRWLGDVMRDKVIRCLEVRGFKCQALIGAIKIDWKE